MDTLFREGCDISSMILYHSGKELVHGRFGRHDLGGNSKSNGER